MRKKLRTVYSHWNRWIHRYINGLRGVVSLFLVICMAPLLSMALLLVESARYQSATELLQEILDSAGLSTLAGYDSYLEDRFGLLALSQEDAEDYSAVMETYITLNNDALGNSASVDSVSVSGAYALSDVDIFEQQILEYCEVSAPVKSIVEELNISSLIQKLEESVLGKETVDQISKIETLAESTSDAYTAIADLLDALVTLKEKEANYQNARDNYEEKFESFYGEVLDLIEAMKTAEEEAQEAEEDSEDSESTGTTETTDIYETSGVKNALSAVDSARKEYKTALGTLKSEFSTYTSAISDVWNKIESATDSAYKISTTDISSSSSGSSETDADKNTETVSDETSDWAAETVYEVESVFDALFGDDYEETAAEMKNAMNKQETLLSSSFDATQMDSSWGESDLKAWMKEESHYYWTVDTSIGGDDVAAKLDSLVAAISAYSATSSETGLGLSSYISLAKNLAGLTGIYDGSLNALVSSSYSSGAEIYAELATASINDILDAGQLLIDATTKLYGISGFLNSISALKDVVKAVVKLVKGLVEFIAGIVTFVGKLVEHIGSLVSMGVSGDLGRYYLLAAYSAYNMPNRTNATSGSSLSGYSYSKVAALNGGISSSTLLGSLADYASGTSVTTSKPTFYGAELEYLIAGTNDEIGNQTATFMAIYMERFLFNFISIFSDGEVQLQASLAGPAAWVVYVVLLIFEPLVDTLLMVNGKDIYLIKKFVYLTPSGSYKLLQDLLSCASVTKQQKTELENAINEFATTDFTDYKKFSYTGFLAMNYTEHSMLLLMLTVDKDTLLERLQNIVQMESAVNGTFALSEAYTAVYADVTFTLNPMFNLETLTENGLFRFHQTGYFSY